MSSKFPEYKKLDLPGVNQEIQKKWEKDDTFRKSIEIREGKKDFVFLNRILLLLALYGYLYWHCESFLH